jgi:glucoamylase
MDHMSWGIGLMPEQVWEDPDIPAAPYGSNPATASIGFIDGKAAGSATPLIWAEGQYVRLIRDLQTGTLTDQPAITKDRYLTSGPPTNIPITISSPTSGATVTGSTTVTGTTAPGAQVVVSTAQTGSTADSTTLVQTSAPNGQFSATLPTPPGSDVITAVSRAGSHSSGYAQETVTAG